MKHKLGKTGVCLGAETTDTDRNNHDYQPSVTGCSGTIEKNSAGTWRRKVLFCLGVIGKGEKRLQGDVFSTTPFK